jgi:hypothetical protein
MNAHKRRSVFAGALRFLATLAGAVTLASLPGWADETDSRQAGVAGRFRQIETRYQAELIELQAAKAEVPALLELGRRRDQQFARLLDESKEARQDALTARDLAALATCCEYLRRREECLDYCRRAVSLDPDDHVAYFPFVRTLLNLNQDEEAEQILAAAEKRFPKTSPIQELHALVYMKSAWSAHPERAARHISQLLEYYLATLDASPAQPRFAATYLEAYFDARRSSATTQEINQDLERFLKQVEQHLRPAGDHIKPATPLAATSLHNSALHHLRCEIVRLAKPDQFAAARARWLDDLSAAVQNRPQDVHAHAEMHHAAVYTALHSHLDAADEVRRLTSSVRRAIAAQQDCRRDHGEKNSLSDAAVKSLQRLAHLYRRQAAVSKWLGAPAGPLQELDWLEEDDVASLADQPVGPIVVFCWSPWMENGLQAVGSLASLQARLAKHGAQLVCLAPYSGFHWDAETFRVERKETQTAAAERAALAAFLRSQQIALPCCLAPKQSFFSDVIDPEGLEPQFLILDSRRAVRTIIVGTSDAKLRFLEEAVARAK